MTVSATDIYKLLEYKFPVERFLTVPECKVGSTWFKSVCSRFDMWVMSRSWVHPRFIGCEIKVSRQDFLNDSKWPSYLPYCTEFYFVSAYGIIDSGEVPEQAGLMVASKNCKQLTIKKKAPVREVVIPQSLLIYILMCRARITSDNTGHSKTRLWQDRLREMESNKKLGSGVAFHVRRLAEERIKEVLAENRELKDENHKLYQIKECMDSLGIKNSESAYAMNRAFL